MPRSIHRFITVEQRIGVDGLTIEREMRFIDEGYSGSTLVRPALERLRDMADAGAIDRLYVLSPDRLARNYAYQVVLVDELRRCGVEIVFLNHELGRSPRGGHALAGAGDCRAVRAGADHGAQPARQAARSAARLRQRADATAVWVSLHPQISRWW